MKNLGKSETITIISWQNQKVESSEEPRAT